MAAGGGIRLLSLPDEVLATICSYVLDQEAMDDRYDAPQRHVALTCRRLRAAANSPAVLRTLAATIGGPRSSPADFIARLQSLTHFVQREAAPHVRRLRLLLLSPPGMEPGHWLDAGMLLASTVQACRRLEVLEVMARGGLKPSVGPWVSGLTALRRLTIGSYDALSVTADLRPLGQLRDLAIVSAVEVEVQHMCRLPPGLTRLTLQHVARLPGQMAALTALEELRLTSAAPSPEEYGLLERLTRLRRLNMKRCRLPACLGRLTTLRSLRLGEHMLVDPQDAAVCGEALPRLAGVRDLEVCNLAPPVSEALPRCTLHVLGVCPPKPSAAVPAALPAGQWLAELRKLAAPAALLHANTAQLQAAARLRDVVVLHADACSDGLPAVVTWAASHAPLRVLVIDGTRALPPAAWACVLEAQRRRPELRILPRADATER